MSETHDRAIRGRFHSWFLAATENAMHEMYGRRKQELFGALPEHFVEIGPGTGNNFRYYPRGQKLVAIEPNLKMYPRLRAKAQEFGVDVDLRGLRGESIDLPDESTDLVICTLVLCSVDEPERVVAEIRRILRPGGRYVFIEHVAARPGSKLRTLQDWVQRPWTYCFEGCRPNRESWKVVEDGGFTLVDMERFEMHSPFVHVRPQIAGVATK